MKTLCFFFFFNFLCLLVQTVSEEWYRQKTRVEEDQPNPFQYGNRPSNYLVQG